MKWYSRIGNGLLIYILCGVCAIFSIGGGLQDLSGTKILFVGAWPLFMLSGVALSGDGNHCELGEALFVNCLAVFALGCLWIISFIYRNSSLIKWIIRLTMITIGVSFGWIYIAQVQNVVCK